MKIADRIMDLVHYWKVRGYKVDALYLGTVELSQLDLEEHFTLSGALGTRWKWNGMEIYRVDAREHLSVSCNLR
jgi:hypothetical protein